MKSKIPLNLCRRWIFLVFFACGLCLLLHWYRNVNYRSSMAPELESPVYPGVIVVTPNKTKDFEKLRSIAYVKSDHQQQFNETRRPTKVIFLATAFHGAYNLYHYFSPQIGSEHFERYSCPYSDCVFTTDGKELPNADVVLFHLRDISILTFGPFSEKREQRQKWILYTMEPPWLEITDLSKLDGHFNWTMSYRRDSDIVVRYGFIGRRSSNRDNQNIQIEGKERLAVMVAADCCTESNREDYVLELQKYAKVDVLGSCGPQSCYPAESRKCYEEFAKKYYFYLSFENSICKDYTTEKFFNVLEQDMVPVSFGGAKYFAPEGSYVDATLFPDPKVLVERLIAISKNETWYRSFFDWKNELQVYAQAWPCDLCKKVHTQFETLSIRKDLSKWWRDEASCKQWNVNERTFGPVTEGRNQMPCYHTHMFKNSE